MKKCRTVDGLKRALRKGESAQLLVWDVMVNHFDVGGVYLNLGGGAYAYVGKETWEAIRDFVVNSNGNYYKNINKFQSFYLMKDAG